MAKVTDAVVGTCRLFDVSLTWKRESLVMLPHTSTGNKQPSDRTAFLDSLIHSRVVDYHPSQY